MDKSKPLSFEAVKVAMRQDKSGFILTLNIHPDEVPPELFRSWVGSRYGVALVRINDDESTDREVDRRVMSAGILCTHATFWEFLETKYRFRRDAIHSEEKCAEVVRGLLGISSRTELITNKDAQEKFDIMVEEYGKYQSKVPF